MAACLSHLQRYRRVCVSITCRQRGERRERNPKLSIRVPVKFWRPSFFDCRGPLFIDYLERGTTINAKSYTDTMQKLRRAIKSKRPGMLSEGIILLHDKDRSHTAYLMRNKCQRYGWETLQHPPYIPDLSLVTSTFFATWGKTFQDFSFIRTRKLKSGWGCGSISD